MNAHVRGRKTKLSFNGNQSISFHARRFYDTHSTTINKNQTSFKVKMNLEYKSNEVQLIYTLPKILSKSHKIFNQKFKTIHMASSGYTSKKSLISENKIVKTTIK